MLAVAQSFEPAGVVRARPRRMPGAAAQGARPLRPGDGALLANLDLLARRDFAALMRVCGVDAEDLADMIAEIRRAQPEARPRLRLVPWSSRSCRTSSCAPAPDGGWHVELKPTRCRACSSIRRYYARVAKSRAQRRRQAYLAECLQTANWLVKSLDQRARTILKVATEIVRQQDAFLATASSICGRST